MSGDINSLLRGRGCWWWCYLKWCDVHSSVLLGPWQCTPCSAMLLSSAFTRSSRRRWSEYRDVIVTGIVSHNTTPDHVINMASYMISLQLLYVCSSRTTPIRQQVSPPLPPFPSITSLPSTPVSFLPLSSRPSPQSPQFRSLLFCVSVFISYTYQSYYAPVHSLLTRISTQNILYFNRNIRVIASLHCCGWRWLAKYM